MGIYDQYLAKGLYEAFLVSTLSRFESFLADVLFAFFMRYPLRITQKVGGIPACPEMSAADVIRAEDKDDLVRKMIHQHIEQVFRQRPSMYMRYLVEIIGVEDDKSFLDYYEVSATRDLIVHSNGVINRLYMEKSGEKSRGAIGDRLTVDKKYFDAALAKIKRVSGSIKRDVEKKYLTKSKT